MKKTRFEPRGEWDHLDREPTPNQRPVRWADCDNRKFYNQQKRERDCREIITSYRAQAEIHDQCMRLHLHLFFTEAKRCLIACLRSYAKGIGINI